MLIKVLTILVLLVRIRNLPVRFEDGPEESGTSRTVVV